VCEPVTDPFSSSPKFMHWYEHLTDLTLLPTHHRPFLGPPARRRLASIAPVHHVAKPQCPHVRWAWPNWHVVVSVAVPPPHARCGGEGYGDRREEGDGQNGSIHAESEFKIRTCRFGKGENRCCTPPSPHIEVLLCRKPPNVRPLLCIHRSAEKGAKEA